MTSTHARHAPGASRPASSQFRKVSRAELRRLRVVADICPQALLRVLGLIAQHGLVPLTISAERTQRRQRFVIEIDTLSEQSAAVLVAKVESIVTVRSARLARTRKPAKPSGLSN